MKFVITSTAGDVQQILEPTGTLVEPSEIDNKFYIELDSLDDLIHLSELLNCEIIVRHDEKFHQLEIYNDYR